MQALLDTNIIIELWKNNSLIIPHTSVFLPVGLPISSVTEAEFLMGALNKEDLRKIKQELLFLEVLLLEQEIGILANQLLATYTLSQRLKLADALTAATALHHYLPLYTLNRKDFRYLDGSQLHEPA